LREFDILGFTIPYETLYTNVFEHLDLAGIPLSSSKRGNDYPLIIAEDIRPSIPNPWPIFIDAFVIGEGEEVIHEIREHAAKNGKSQARIKQNYYSN